jgi:subtilisin family serine protease
MRNRPVVLLLVTLLAATPAGAALRLKLPVRSAGSSVPAPAYQGDLFELTLTRPAARVAAARGAGLERMVALGILPLDRLAAAMDGVWFEPEFRSEAPPEEGSDEPDFTTFYLAHLPPGVELADALERFRALGEVVRADPIACLPVSAFPNDSLFNASPWYYQPPSRNDIHAPEAWDVTVGDTSIVVAIIDTGVLSDHPDLGGTRAGSSGQIWTNWAEAGGVPGVDDDGNGYVDDLHGWDFVAFASDGSPGEDTSFEDNDPSDFDGHGTACAGLVGAITNNTIGVSGVAWNVRLMPLRMGWHTNQGGEVDMAYAARAIRYATRNGAQVLNCSWESDTTGGIIAALTAAVRAGVTVVSAAGNGSPFHYLGDRDDVLAIAATDASDNIATFSNVGSWVDLAAPGVGIRSTWSVQRTPAYIEGINGTSFSCPLTAGVAALIRSQPTAGSHPITPRGIQLRLMESADDISAQNPTLAGLYGAGRLNAYRALTETSGSRVVRTGSRSVGASVLIPTNGAPHVAFLTLSRRLVELDAVTGDTVMVQTLVGNPNGDLAAADLGGTLGVGLFYATLGDGVSMLLAGQGAAPGDWPQPGSTPYPMNTPALGDLDGDGVLEVVSCGDDGQLWAWHLDGSSVNGYPISTGFYPLLGPLLTDLDGVPGAEVVVAAQDGNAYAFGAGGVPLPGWPVTVAMNPHAPVAGRLGPNASPVIVISAGNQLYAFSPSGALRPGFPVTLGGNATQDPALGDLNGDGFDEIVVATVVPSSIEVRDTLGASVSALHWPRPLPGQPQSPPLLGELASASPGPELFLMRGASLLALTHDADSLASFPKPGRAGFSPSLGQADADANTEVVAGTGIDSLFYLYDAGPGSNATAGNMPWPTPRGNYARTGSRFYAPPLGTQDVLPPAAIADLTVGAYGNTYVQLRWTAPVDPGPLGQANLYEVRRAAYPLTEGNFASAIPVPNAPSPAPGFEPESLLVAGLPEATLFYFGIRSVDQVGNRSAIATLAASTTGGPPGPVTDLRSTAVTDSSVSLTWTATGGDGAIGRPYVYQIRGSTTPIDSASFDSAPLQWTQSATVDAGGSESLVFPGLSAATRYWFALKAVDVSDNLSPLSNVPVIQTGVGGPLNGRTGLALAVLQNPARGSAEFFWQAAEGAGGAQSIHLYDLTGRRVRVIDVGTGLGGQVKWDGRDAEGRSVPAGLYYARLLSGSFHTQTRLVLLP